MKPTQLRRSPDPFKAMKFSGPDCHIVWIDEAGKTRTTRANNRATALDFHLARACRQAVKRSGRPNYEGYYWFAATEQGLWFESLVEYNALMALDHVYALRGVATQPMCIFFPNGTRHYPDFFAVHEDGTQALFDVRPKSLITAKTHAQFDATQALCDNVGWKYEVLTELTPIVRYNLEWLAAYRQPWFRPDPETEDQIVSSVEKPTPLLEVATALDPEYPARYIHAIYNAMWRRLIVCDMTHRLSFQTRLQRNGHARNHSRI